MNWTCSPNLNSAAVRVLTSTKSTRAMTTNVRLPSSLKECQAAARTYSLHGFDSRVSSWMECGVQFDRCVYRAHYVPDWPQVMVGASRPQCLSVIRIANMIFCNSEPHNTLYKAN
ncbi:hypothetical protein VTP01DRAFT_1060 [Rhizomucor pusillus]|uniref:uncharacterized protein n=1 Tax=Rhizomucor pusillus TaxID=4840 RepID=UPI00374400A4